MDIATNSLKKEGGGTIVTTLLAPSHFLEQSLDLVRGQFVSDTVRVTLVSETIAFSYLLNSGKTRYILHMIGPQNAICTFADNLRRALDSRIQHMNYCKVLDWQFAPLATVSEDSETNTEHGSDTLTAKRGFKSEGEEGKHFQDNLQEWTDHNRSTLRTEPTRVQPTERLEQNVSKSNRSSSSKVNLTKSGGIFWSGLFAVLAAALAIILLTSRYARKKIDISHAERIVRAYLTGKGVGPVHLLTSKMDHGSFNFAFRNNQVLYAVAVDELGRVIGYREESEIAKSN